jgi:hypothetical protein
MSVFWMLKSSVPNPLLAFMYVCVLSVAEALHWTVSPSRESVTFRCLDRIHPWHHTSKGRRCRHCLSFFSCGLCNDVVNIASNLRKIDKWYIVKDLEGSGRGIIELLCDICLQKDIMSYTKYTVSLCGSVVCFRSGKFLLWAVPYHVSLSYHQANGSADSERAERFVKGLRIWIAVF